jgi:hypothetical protein
MEGGGGRAENPTNCSGQVGKTRLVRANSVLQQKGCLSSQLKNGGGEEEEEKTNLAKKILEKRGGKDCGKTRGGRIIRGGKAEGFFFAEVLNAQMN